MARPLVVAVAAMILTAGCGTTSPSPLQDRLRIRNAANVPIESLVIQFPEDRIPFGTLAAGATSSYLDVPHGVYSYSAFEARINGATLVQPVIDWVGEQPMDGEAFTYTINLVQLSDRTFINIVNTTKDR